MQSLADKMKEYDEDQWFEHLQSIGKMRRPK